MTSPRAADANISAAVALKMSSFAAYNFLIPTLPDVLNFFSGATKDPSSKEDDANEPELSLDLIRVDDDDRPQAGNDFIVSKGVCSSTARFLAVIFAERRFTLYGSSLADRTYNVYLPTGLLAMEGQGETASAGGDYLLIPSLTFVRRPGNVGFRGTFTFLATLLPVASATTSPFDENSLKRRPMTSKEIEHATIPWTSSRGSRDSTSRGRRPTYRLEGDLRSYLLDLGESEHLAGRGTLRWWMETILWAAGRAVATRERLSNDEGPDRTEQNPARRRGDGALRLLGDDVIRSMAASKGSVIMVASDKAAEEVANWNSEEKAPGLEKELKSLLKDMETFTPEPIRLKRLSLPREEMDAWNHVALHIPRSGTVFLLPKSAERFPHNSLLWATAWMANAALGLSSAREMISAFFSQVESYRDRYRATQISHELLVDFDEIYDLDFVNPAYRRFYEKVRERDGIPHDHDLLRSKVDLLNAELEAEETADQTRLLIAFTLGILFGTLSLVLAQSDVQQGLGPKELAAHIPTACAVLAVGSVGFALPVFLRRLGRGLRPRWSSLGEKLARLLSKGPRSTDVTGRPLGNQDPSVQTSSILPPIAAIGLAMLLTGLVLNLVVVGVGVAITAISIVLWVREALGEYRDLPRS
jgi:hypothetical protein